MFIFVLFRNADGPLYDSSAYTECKKDPESPLYKGGILENHIPPVNHSLDNAGTGVYSPAFVLSNLTQGTKYCFSSYVPVLTLFLFLAIIIYDFATWVQIKGAESAQIRASLSTEHKNSTYKCIGTVIARSGCWSFLKGGFVLNSSSNTSLLFFQNADEGLVDISIASSSLQPFTDEQWSKNQEYKINTERKRAVTLHVSDTQGNIVEGAQISVQQISKEFPFGSAIAKTIIGNLPYQDWFVKRFNAAVFENELKWYATEPEQGKINYTIADQMLKFIRANQIAVRGDELKTAVSLRIQSLMSKYKEEFIHWDVSNEMLHFDFYEQKLGPNATLDFFKTAHQSDPLATLFMNEFNVVETCTDVNSTVDSYILRVKELKRGGATMDGIGLEGHFAAIYLEQVLREGFSHPSVNGIMLWTALHPNGCYEMCLTDNEIHNLPAGDVVDKLLQEWQTGERKGKTDEHGSYSFFGFLGEYNVNVTYGSKSINSTFSLCKSDETRHFSIKL
ncbi:hypothetical protein IFM89_034007 [Coptis chinensis]|uniref:GH10 domain-containing protein n=1 Tax=Coptis chinensis TaxID=261450 RepID=A0A835IV15_9MAGN|nr:hypothetical protein IFM89_034007 [Coptis chinensis]